MVFASTAKACGSDDGVGLLYYHHGGDSDVGDVRGVRIGRPV